MTLHAVGAGTSGSFDDEDFDDEDPLLLLCAVAVTGAKSMIII
jgi:hypothetical protein